MTTKPFKFFLPLSTVKLVTAKKRKKYETNHRHKRLPEMAELTPAIHTWQMKLMP